MVFIHFLLYLLHAANIIPSHSLIRPAALYPHARKIDSSLLHIALVTQTASFFRLLHPALSLDAQTKLLLFFFQYDKLADI